MVSTPYARVAAELWRGAPLWRGVVMAASVLSAGAMLHAWLGSPGTPAMADFEPVRSRPAPLPPDPASESRLSAYEAEHREALTITNAAARCEKLAAAWARLEDLDRARGRHPSAPRSRVAAVIDGTKCAADIVASETRFKALEQAVAAAARAANAGTLTQVATAVRALNAFDRARPRAAGDAALLARGQAIIAEFDAGDRRIDEASKAVAALTAGRSPATAVAAAEAWQRLSEIDRARLTPAQQTGLAPAEEALRLVNAARTRLRRVEQTFAAAPSPAAAAPARRQLVESVAALSDLDRAIATQEQKAVLQKADDAAVAAGLVLLKEQVDEFRRDASPASHQRLAALWAVLRERLPRDRSPEQEQLLAVARTATEALKASDDRLGMVVRASEMWSQGRAPETVRLVTQALRDTTDFDRRRFEEPHRRGWEKLQTAELIVRGPELSLTTATKPRMPIHVAPGKRSATDAPLAAAVAEALRRAGFVIVRERVDAALGIDASAAKISDPTPDYRGAVVSFRVDATIELNAIWTIDESSFLTAQASGAGNAPNSDRGALQAAALRASIDEFVRQFQARVDQGR